MSTFKVSSFTFVEKLPDKKGIFEEIEVTEDVELRHAERTVGRFNFHYFFVG